MLDPTLRSLFVGLVMLILRYIFNALGVPVEDAVLTALAVAIIGWIIGNPAGSAAARAAVRATSRPE